MLIDPENQILFLRRTDGFWDYSGGRQEDGEEPLETAVNELEEETGFKLNGHPIEESFSTCLDDDLVFVTFVVYVPGKFKPTLSKEHTEFVWLTPNQARELLDLLPGVRVALNVLEEDS